jgi:hypothetical protein
MRKGVGFGIGGTSDPDPIPITRKFPPRTASNCEAGALQTAPRGWLRINAPISFGLLYLTPAVNVSYNAF